MAAWLLMLAAVPVASRAQPQPAGADAQAAAVLRQLYLRHDDPERAIDLMSQSLIVLFKASPDWQAVSRLWPGFTTTVQRVLRVEYLRITPTLERRLVAACGPTLAGSLAAGELAAVEAFLATPAAVHYGELAAASVAAEASRQALAGALSGRPASQIDTSSFRDPTILGQLLPDELATWRSFLATPLARKLAAVMPALDACERQQRLAVLAELSQTVLSELRTAALAQPEIARQLAAEQEKTP